MASDGGRGGGVERTMGMLRSWSQRRVLGHRLKMGSLTVELGRGG